MPRVEVRTVLVPASTAIPAAAAKKKNDNHDDE
jgi:hypothetical protein